MKTVTIPIEIVVEDNCTCVAVDEDGIISLSHGEMMHQDSEDSGDRRGFWCCYTHGVTELHEPGVSARVSNWRETLTKVE